MTLAEARAAPPLPSFVQIEPVGQCNLRCRMCPVAFRGDGGPGKPPAFMKYDEFLRLIEQFPGMTGLHLQGLGEPMLHPRFFDMVRHAAGRGILVSTNTNLTAVSERRIEECVASGLARMHVSLDAAERGTYEYIRTGARYDKVLRNLRLLVAAKKRNGGERPEIHLVAVVMRRNLSQLPGLVRVAAEFGLQGISVQHLCHDFSEGTLPPQYASMREFIAREMLVEEDAALVDEWFAAARAVADSLGVQLRLPRAPRPHPGGSSPAGTAGASLRCDWPWRGAYLSFNGEAMPCCMVATPDRINFGSMAREGVARVWNGEAYRRFREQLASDEPPEICRGCSLYRGTF